MQSVENKMPEFIEENKSDELPIEQQLIEAQKEIEDLKSQLMWMERSYE
ncbi:hypothetical protein tinsulaeT_23430 [Thalassotalea insulae]|uniref:ABC transporter Uup C-terminal domain-containing protein n=1 Tax=Thalassotalea insulae TaxID=2056778 RepID=A0ABQ6GSV3_9GAMM|nr:hypothetical protein [Thalassotalea insulae]GLX79003.1 hypothetical protein tinsulaeT_23430 [Thalassotalea insulae]